jgi:hypothetical protein
MKQPVPPRGHAAAPRPDAPHRGHAPSAPKLDLRVRYYYRMKPQRVYPLVVEVPRGSPAPGPVLEPVVVRPVIPGAHVAPAEQPLDVHRPGEQVTFYVTPLARGRLPAPRVEVLQHGRPAGEVSLRMKGVTQRATWFLLLLTLVVPCLVFYVTRHPLSAVTRHKLITPDFGRPAEDKNNEGGGEKKKAEPDDANKEAAAPADPSRLLVQADADDKKDEKGDDKKDARGGARQGGGQRQPGREGPAGRPRRPAGDNQPAGVPPAGDVAGPEPGARGDVGHEMALPETPGPSLEYYLNQEAKEDFPDVPLVTETIVPPVASWLGLVYGVACEMPSLYLWVGLTLFGLTVISCYLHAARRTSRRVRLDLITTRATGTALETLPLGPGEGRPLSVEPG